MIPFDLPTRSAHIPSLPVMCPTSEICSAVSLAERWLDGGGDSRQFCRSNFKSSRNWGKRPHPSSCSQLRKPCLGRLRGEPNATCLTLRFPYTPTHLERRSGPSCPICPRHGSRRSSGSMYLSKKGQRTAGVGIFAHHRRPSSSHGSSEHRPVEKNQNKSTIDNYIILGFGSPNEDAQRAAIPLSGLCVHAAGAPMGIPSSLPSGSLFLFRVPCPPHVRNGKQLRRVRLRQPFCGARISQVLSKKDSPIR